ncbi:NYN domain-containing protein [Massilia sp. TSP1-1-2]|uniref:NYN domain-containing protein n=1 Tax=Massilia sp. TSP1-1-2 TaxID=2804649 RepID=UPI003CEBAC39
MIDADNAQFSIIQELLAEVSRHGVASVKRAYGDWTTNLKGWKDTLHRMAIQPMQQFSYTTGKNSKDSALIIDAGFAPWGASSTGVAWFCPTAT